MNVSLSLLAIRFPKLLHNYCFVCAALLAAFDIIAQMSFMPLSKTHSRPIIQCPAAIVSIWISRQARQSAVLMVP